MVLMKSLSVFLLLLINNLSYIEAADKDDPPYFSIEKITELDPLGKGQEANRIAVIDLKEQNYLMRFDPPEHCGRIVICGKEEATKTKKCAESAGETIILNPLGDGKIYKQSGAKFEPLKQANSEVIMKEDNIFVSYKPKYFTLKFNPRSVQSGASFEHKFSKTNIDVSKLRIETSSFYCNVHIATTNEAVLEIPNIHIPKDPSTPPLIPFPFPLGKFEKQLDARTEDKFFGPLFSKLDKLEKPELEKIKASYKVDPSSQCPFPHDLIGFSKWSMPLNKDNATRYKDNILRHNVYRYDLTKPDSCGEYPEKPYQIDIEIGATFNPDLNNKYHRCLGFALAFGKKDAADYSRIDIDPKKTFEFYIAAAMFLAPDSNKIRALRVARDALKKIRISYFKKSDLLKIVHPFATVEYDFLNDDVAGVREYIQVPYKIEDFDSVSVFSEGYCEVRVLEVKTPTEDCMKVVGCDVLTRK